MKYSYQELAKMIDHSLLQPSLTDRELEQGCALAAKYQVASVCVKPCDVKRARELIAGTGVLVGSVIGFPHGNSTTEVKRYETRLACQQGAVEIDMVINIGKALSGEMSYVESEVRAVAEEAHQHGAVLKVIFENGLLPNDEIKIQLCQICERAGADYVKTSTGYGFVQDGSGNFKARGATDHDLQLMRANTSPSVHVKAAGGIRSLDALIRARELGVARCGTSSTASILEEYHRRASGTAETTAILPESNSAY